MKLPNPPRDIRSIQGPVWAAILAWHEAEVGPESAGVAAAKIDKAIADQLRAHAEEAVKAAVLPNAEALVDLISRHLTSAYACNRVWSAWSIGTMSEDDFTPLAETSFAADLAGEIASLISTSDTRKGPTMRNLRFKRVMRYDATNKQFRFFRVMWESGDGPGTGRGFSHKLAVSIKRCLPRVSLHRSAGGTFV